MKTYPPLVTIPSTSGVHLSFDQAGRNILLGLAICLLVGSSAYAALETAAPVQSIVLILDDTDIASGHGEGRAQPQPTPETTMLLARSVAFARGMILLIVWLPAVLIPLALAAAHLIEVVKEWFSEKQPSRPKWKKPQWKKRKLRKQCGTLAPSPSEQTLFRVCFRDGVPRPVWLALACCTLWMVMRFLAEPHA